MGTSVTRYDVGCAAGGSVTVPIGKHVLASRLKSPRQTDAPQFLAALRLEVPRVFSIAVSRNSTDVWFTNYPKVQGSHGPLCGEDVIVSRSRSSFSVRDSRLK